MLPCVVLGQAKLTVLTPHRAEGAAEGSVARRLSTGVAGDAQQMVVPPSNKTATATAQKARTVGLRVAGVSSASSILVESKTL